MPSLRTGRRGPLGAAAGVLAVAAIAMLIFAGTGSAKPNDAATHSSAKAGGTVSMALPPSTVVNYIFPFMGLQFFSVYNISYMQQLMYRPLYWFGRGTSPALNPLISLASLPKYSKNNTVVSFTLKPYKWSNGESVTAQQVVFWMNILKVQKLGWAAYSPGGMPDDVKSVVANSPTKVTITLTGPTNPGWFTYNQLSQITPFPMAWDISATGQKAGSEACAKAPYAKVVVKTDKKNSKVTPVSPEAKSCEKVFEYLSRQSGFDPKNPKAPNNSLKTYATNPLWQIVDGPWHLTKFDSSGNVTMVPNPKYSGPVKPKIDKFVLLPFTSNAAEFNALVGGKIDVGYLPFEDVTSPAKSPLVPGKNHPRLEKDFNIDAWYGWGIYYIVPNFNSTGNGGQAGKIFKQLYFRQAFQLLINQPLYLEKLYKNYGTPTYGPVPVLPKNPFATKFAASEPVLVQPEEGDRPAHVARLEGRAEGRHELHRRREVRRARRHEAPVLASVRDRLGCDEADDGGGAGVVAAGRHQGESDRGELQHGDRQCRAVHGQVVHVGDGILGRLDLRARLLPERRVALPDRSRLEQRFLLRQEERRTD